MSENIAIREFLADDCKVISRAFAAQGWHKSAAQYREYLDEQAAGLREVLIAEWDRKFAGYVTVVWQSHYAFFRERGIPEIVDLNVLIHYRRRGIASALLEQAEQRITERSAIAGIGVGLTADYGAAHILYITRGYIPDGRGVIQRDRQLRYGDMVTVDDDLVLYLTKRIKKGT